MKLSYNVKEFLDDVIIGPCKIGIPISILSAAIVFGAIGCTRAHNNSGVAKEFEFKGHHYLMISDPERLTWSNVHDPDCKCRSEDIRITVEDHR